MSKPITVADLKDQLGTPFPRPMLFCPYCGNESSAHAADYFLARPSHVFMCCDEPMKLVIKRTTREEIEP